MVKDLSVDEKINLIKNFAQEIVEEDELRTLFKKGGVITAYDGFEPSGVAPIHFGLLRATNLKNILKTGIRFKLYLADYFGFINNKLGGDLEKIQLAGKYFIEVWKACGVDMKKVEVVWASDLMSGMKNWDRVLRVAKVTSVNRTRKSLTIAGRKEGDVISATGSDDPDVYIANAWGYRRLFLNPVIFSFYGHLGFNKVKKVTSSTRDTLVASGLFRKNGDAKVYGVETTGEDTGKLHWINMTGAQAVAEDANFFKKVFIINDNEFNWYPKGADYTSLSQVPNYIRTNTPTSTVLGIAVKRYKVIGTDQLNVRELPSTSSKLLGKLPEGQTIESLSQQGLWHKIKYQNNDAWVHGSYLQAL